MNIEKFIESLTESEKSEIISILTMPKKEPIRLTPLVVWVAVMWDGGQMSVRLHNALKMILSHEHYGSEQYFNGRFWNVETIEINELRKFRNIGSNSIREFQMLRGF